MKIKCIDNNICFLTKGKVYKVIEIEKDFYWIWNDEGEYYFYNKELFKKIEMKKTEVTEESLRKAYNEGCEDVKATLRNLYPEFEFEKNKYFDLSELQAKIVNYKIFTEQSSKNAGFSGRNFFQIRADGDFTYKSFLLTDQYNWEIKRDNQGELCLIPTRK